MTEVSMQRSPTSLSRWKKVCGVVALLFLMAGSIHPNWAADSPTPGGTDSLLHVGFSKSMFVEVNENDVKAAVKGWAQVLMKGNGLSVDPQISVMNGTEEISRALRGKLVDAFALTTEEYWVLEKDMQSSHAVLGAFDGRLKEEYVILVHRESGVERIGDLRGRNINLFQNPRMSLAQAWLDLLLVQAGLEPASKHFNRISQLNKLPRAVLPVFFRQSDACLVTRRGFETMSELNPQVDQKLRVIASSPELVPAGFFLRGDLPHSMRDKMFVEFSKIHEVPSGRQALLVFQSGNLEVHPISVLNSAFDLLNSHRRLCASTSGAKTIEAGVMSKEAKIGVH
jgi:phosphonate transport system substrate-binding protein